MTRVARRSRLALPVVAAAWACGMLAAPGAAQGTAPPQGQDAAPGDDALRIYLMTMEQGAFIWEHFGHNALVIEDRALGTQVAWHWGLFDFTEPGFVPRFLRGEMLYSMGAFDAGAMVRAYERQNRTTTIQELDLTQAQAAAIQDFVAWNSQPENRHYRYDYFVDNCSTRIRDLLDQVLDGRLAERFQAQSAGFSYRHETDRLTGRAPWDYLGITLLLGPRGDEVRSRWEQMFTPLNLRLWLRDFELAGPSGPRPLVTNERILFQGTRPPPLESPPAMGVRMAALGALVGVVFVLLAGLAGRRPGRLVRLPLAVAGGLWSLVAGLAGAILVGVYWTDHVWMYGNENVLQSSPLSLIVAVALPVAVMRRGTLIRTRRLVLAVAGLSVLGALAQVLPGVDQVNGVIIALALPAHLGLAWAIHRLSQADSGGRSPNATTSPVAGAAGS